MRIPQKTRSKSLSSPAPIGGLNAHDALAAMPPDDAVTMDNMFPTTTSVDLRNGYELWASGLPADVETLMAYRSATTTQGFAASGTAFYDVSNQGAVGAPVVSGLANARWQTVNFGTPGGQFLYCVNGADYPQVYNGTTWAQVASVAAQTISSITRVGTLATLTAAAPHGLVTGNQITVTGATSSVYNGTYIVTVTGASTLTYVMASDPGGGASVVGTYIVSPAVTGVDPRNLIHVNLYKNRLFFVEKNSLSVWYMPLNSISGAASEIDLSPLFKMGGYLMAMVTWTIDNAAGVNEYAGFISSEGEVVIYLGTDPATADNWNIEATFHMGRPVGRRCFVKVGSDVIVICADGFYPLSKALLTDRSQQQDAISDKIVNLVNNDVKAYAANFGWQACLYPTGNKLIINVPRREGEIQYQYVMNTITGAWCRFTGWNANCFETMNDELFFGGNLGYGANTGYVAKADVGFSDNGAFINAEVKTAFRYFGALGQLKRFTMCRPIFFTAGALQAALSMDVDFQDIRPTAAPSFSGTAGTLWNTAPWNSFPWGDVEGIKQDWQGVTGVGQCGALHMLIKNNATLLQWQSVDYVYEVGGVI